MSSSSVVDQGRKNKVNTTVRDGKAIDVGCPRQSESSNMPLMAKVGVGFGKEALSPFQGK